MLHPGPKDGPVDGAIQLPKDACSPRVLGGVQGDFFSVSPNRPSVLCMVVVPTSMLCVACTHWHNSSSVCAGALTTCARSAGSSAAKRSGL